MYTMLSIEEAGIRSFTYELENRVVPYGPNAEWFDGRAVFVNPTEAVDSEAGRTFRLRVDPGDRDERVIELDGESFLFQRRSVEAGERITQVTPIEEAGAFLDAMVACVSENSEAIVESSGDTGPDMSELGARCGLDQDSLSELARALVQDALISQVMFGALAIAFGDLEGEAAVAVLLDALAEAADDVKTMEVSGQLNLELEREVLEGVLPRNWRARRAIRKHLAERLTALSVGRSNHERTGSRAGAGESQTPERAVRSLPNSAS